MMPDVITEVLSSLFTGKAINELFTGRYFLAVNFSLMISSWSNGGSLTVPWPRISYQWIIY